MAIDHRCGARTPLDLEVTLRTQNSGEVRGRVCDISIGGMRIQADADFIPYQPVTIEFAFPPGTAVRSWHAMVVHVDNGSVGVMFEFFRTTDLEKLVQLLRAADRQSSRTVHVAEYRDPPDAVHARMNPYEARTADAATNRVPAKARARSRG